MKTSINNFKQNQITKNQLAKLNGGRAARTGRNPRTNKVIDIPAKRDS